MLIGHRRWLWLGCLLMWLLPLLPQAQAATTALPDTPPPARASAAAPAASGRDTLLPQAPDAAAPSIVLPVINLQGLLPQTAAEDTAEPPPEPSFGTHVLDWLADNGDRLYRTAAANGAMLVQLQPLAKWWAQQTSLPRLLERWRILGEAGGLMLLWGFGGAVGLQSLLTPLRRRARPRHYQPFWRRAGFGALQAALGLLPVLFFLVVALAILGTVPEAQLRAKLVLQDGIYAVVLARLLALAGQTILAPRHLQLRLVPLPSLRAQRLYAWLRVMLALALGGGWVAEAARYLDVPPETQRLFTQLLGLALLVWLIVLVRGHRASVSHWLRGNTAANAGGTLLGWARQNLAAHWHKLTVTYLLIGYSVTMLSPSGTGFAALLRGSLCTLLLFLLMNVVLYGLNQLALRAAAAEARQERLPLHQPVLRGVLRLLTMVGGIYLILLGWNVDFSAWLATELAQRLLGAGVSISAAIVLAVLAYEILCSMLNAAQQQPLGAGGVDRAARVQTLLPLIRNSAAVLLTVAVGLIGLTELGINIAPLLAGAGIVGVAIGFGSQALVKDFITGLFIIIEDTIHVGDVIACDNHAGSVESMTIRTLRLRDVHGALHVVPYSAVTGFINKTRGFAYAVAEFGVAYDSDLRHVATVLQSIGATVQSDPELGQNILTPLELDGVQRFADSAIILRARIKTLPGQQWKVQQALLAAIQEGFAAANIMIPFPTVRHHFSEPPTALAQLAAQAPPLSKA
jgi:moderate conductance mechanosensitive channel